MNTNKIVMGAIGIMVAVVMIGGAFLPAVNSVTATEKTFTNDGYYRMTTYGTDTPIYLEWDYNTADKITINDVIYSIPVGGGPYSLIASDTIGIRSDGSTFCQVITNLETVAVDESSTLKANFIDGTATCTEYVNGEESRTVTKEYSQLYVINNDGDYVMKKNNTVAYMLDDSMFFGCGITTLFSTYIMLNVTGTISTGATVTQITTANQLTYSDIVIHSIENTHYTGLYELEKITFNASNGETNTPVTYSYFIVPYKVTVDINNPIGATERAIMSILPIVAVAGLVIAGVYVFISRK